VALDSNDTDACGLPVTVEVGWLWLLGDPRASGKEYRDTLSPQTLHAFINAEALISNDSTDGKMSMSPVDGGLLSWLLALLLEDRIDLPPWEELDLLRRESITDPSTDLNRLATFAKMGRRSIASLLKRFLPLTRRRALSLTRKTDRHAQFLNDSDFESHFTI
jgi:hypothetical protein